MRSTRAATWCMVFSLVGLGLCAYLFILHLGLMRGDLLGGPACGSDGAFNCHAVTASRWGVLFGVPLALWGMLGYLAVLALARLVGHSEEWAPHLLTVIFCLAAAYVIADLFLFGVMALELRAYCLFCLGTYLVNLALLVLSGCALGYPWPQAIGRLPAALGTLVPSGQRRAAWLFWDTFLVAAVAVAGLHLATIYVSRGSLGSMRKQIADFAAKQPRVSIQTEGDPSIGPAEAPIHLVEFSDFLCPACQRASKMNHVILAGHRRDVHFVFKQYPLDTNCNTIPRSVHPGACLIAAATECAHRQGKFWELHDLIFKDGPRYNFSALPADAQRLGLNVEQFQACLDSGEGMEAVKRDIAEAQRVGVNSTPTYVINGLPVPGGITPALFDDLLHVLRQQSSGGS